MSWFKIDLMYGAGHQGHRVEYEWREGEVTKIDKQEMVDDLVNRIGTNQAIGKVRRVKNLPEEVRLNKINQELHRIKRAEYMLRVLEKP